MLHALDNETKRVLLPNLPTIDDRAKAILADNRTFLERPAVHAFADFLKDDKSDDNHLSEHIRFKGATFMRMTGSSMDSSVTRYGWNPDEEEDVTELRAQYVNVTRMCYQEGYRKLRST